jgi:2-dehydropantoate 2-reductase
MGERMSVQGTTTVAVVGVGGIGGVVACELARHTSADVMLCVRRPFEVLEVEHAGTVVTAPTARVLTDPSDAGGPVDWIMLATKAHQIEGAAPWLDALWGPDTRVAVLQNGVEHRERVRRWTRGDEVLPVVVRVGAEATAPGHIKLSAPGTYTVPAGPLADEFAALAAGSGLEVIRSESFDVDMWTKLAWNIGFNPLTGITGLDGHQITRDPDLATLARRLVIECCTVAAAEGVELDRQLPDVVVAAMHGSADVRSSMAQDRERDRPLEYDAMPGAVVRIGRRHGVAVPVTETISLLLAGISAHAAG